MASRMPLSWQHTDRDETPRLIPSFMDTWNA